MTESCGNCRHKVKYPSANKNECWRFPPNSICITPIKNGMYDVKSVRPEVLDHETCGEWEEE